VIETKQPIKGEVPFTGGSGISGVYEYIFTPVLGPDGAVEVIAGTTRDVTARKRGEDERQELLAREREARADAERASEAKSDFLAALSHELRTPLTPVLLTASIIESHPLLPPELREDIATIRRNVELESRLISDLLDLTRISRGKLQLDMREQDLHRLIESAVDVCQREASAKLIIDLSARHRAVTGDSTRLQQIFWNLINNAIKFTPDDGKITVRSTNVTVNDDPVIRVEVIDTGEGIDPMVLPKLFNAFEQGEVRSVRQQAGLGLGLTISKKLAEAHGGTIRAFSEGRGRGSVFTVDLPVLVECVETSAAPQLPVSTPAGMHPLSVLLVEDHEPTLRVMERLLRQIGHQVTGVQSVAAATSAAARDAYDLIISDLGLPDGSGLDVMRQLRDRYGDRSIALTGYGMESDIVASRDAGFSEHLTKPVDLAALEAAIARVVKTVKTVRPELATASKERNGHSHDGDH
jgi:signal transduction histidine kinase/ActR/RegA family two-component response regulator